jgi:ABC-type uncharacterized transport system ATPase subunit
MRAAVSEGVRRATEEGRVAHAPLLDLPLLDMQGIVKRYGHVEANRGIDLALNRGRILGLLGENGSGKSTLMKVLFGMVEPDEGGILFKGRALARHSPRDAITAGIGMIHQHFTLVEAMTVAENVMLGWERAGRWLRHAEIARAIREISAAYGLDLDPDARIAELPLGLRQRVEIVKAILREVELLILDEPTSNLSPPEIAGLMRVCQRLRDEGRSVIFISHKLREVIELCDDIIVLRDGRVAGTIQAATASAAELARLMVGRDTTEVPPRAAASPGPPRLVLSGVTCAGSPGLAGIDLAIGGGEILGIAGVDGNGQIELAHAIAGLIPITGGTLAIDGSDATRRSVKQRLAAGLAYIPADRSATALVQDMAIEANLVLRDFDRAPFSRRAWLDRKAIRASARRRIAEFAVRAPGPEAPVRQLSGGNQQKIVLARELGRAPGIIVAHQPSWGLDPGASRFVLDQVLALRDAGAAILYISSELDEILLVADRIAVLHNGRIMGTASRDAADPGAIGLMMAGVAPGTVPSERAA